MPKIRLLLLGIVLLTPPAWSAESNSNQGRKIISFPNGNAETTITGRISGRTHNDYQLRAAAGQRLSVSLDSANRSIYFNLLPPGSRDVAMARGEMNDNHYTGLLPDDGLYTIRVFLVRAAARRGSAADYTLKVGADGAPLPPTAASKDALVKGTRYHATATTPCAPAYSQARECATGVVRRGVDGTATVELRWGEGGLRRILFVKGEAKAADTEAAMKSNRNERGWVVEFEGGEHFDIPEPLVFGG